MPQDNQKSQTESVEQDSPQNTQGQGQASAQGNQSSGQQQQQNENKQQIPLNEAQQQLNQKLDQQIQAFEQQLDTKSNSDLKELSGQLDIAERKMLLGKIDNQLKTMKNTIVKPGNVASTAAAIMVSEQSNDNTEQQ